MEKETWFPFLLQSNSLLTIRIKTAFSLQFFKKAPFHRWFLLKALLKAKVFNSSSFCHIYFQQRLCCNKTEPAFHCNRASVLPKYRLCFVQPTCWRVRAHAQAAISPHFTSLLPTWWIYRSRLVDIYIQHGEYIYPSRWIYSSTSKPEKLNALKALPLAYSTFLQGMIFSGFSRYLLPAKRLQIKQKRLKADYSMKVQ